MSIEKENVDFKLSGAKGDGGKYEVVFYDNFDDLDLSQDLLRGVYAYGFEKPSAVQQQAIKPIMEGRDVVVQAPSGTGKTATFLLGAISRIDCTQYSCQGLILASTRELATAIAHTSKGLGTYSKLRSTKCVGGMSVRETMNRLQDGVHLVVGTPGKVNDMMARKFLSTENIKIFVLDEADEMLSRGFRDQIGEIFCHLRREKETETQVVLTSATLPSDVLEVSEKFIQNPVKIVIKRDALTLEGIRQYYVNVEQENWKLDTFCELYETFTICQTVVFCNTRGKVVYLAEKLRERDFTVLAIHCDTAQNEKSASLSEFRSGAARILISSDRHARGIDVAHISLVLNYDLPRNFETYLHRIGRSGAYGRKGVAINFVIKEEMTRLRELEKYFATRIDDLPGDVADLI